MEPVQHVREYFQAEQTESIAFFMIGLITIALSVAVASYFKSGFTKGAAISILPFSIVQLVVGSTIYFRSPDDIFRVEKYYQSDIALLESIEIPRIQDVLEYFEYYRWAEIALVGIGVILVIFVRKNIVQGLGSGLMLQASIMLILDLFAELRAEVYLKQLLESGI